MLTWIVTHSDILHTSLIPLLATFSVAQQRHALHPVEALLLCHAKHKTLLSLIPCLRCPHADQFPLADFFRHNPSQSPSGRQPLPPAPRPYPKAHRWALALFQRAPWWTPLGHQRIEKVQGRTSSRQHADSRPPPGGQFAASPRSGSSDHLETGMAGQVSR